MKNHTKRILDSLKSRPQNVQPIATEMIIPNHSGIKSHPEFQLALSEYVLKAGDTMTGDLNFTGTSSNINFTRDGILTIFRGAMDITTPNDDFTYAVTTHKADGTLASGLVYDVPTHNWTFSGPSNSKVTASSFTSDVATGTAPLTVSSTTKVTNLNADLLDGLDSTNFALVTDLAAYALLAGRSGGQTLIGGTGASENITLKPTSNATRGTVKLDGSTTITGYSNNLSMISLRGYARDTTNDTTGGVEWYAEHNGSGNRQFCVIGTEDLGSSSAAAVRFVLQSGYRAVIDSTSTSGRLTLQAGTDTTGLAIGNGNGNYGSTAAYNQAERGKLDVYGEPSKVGIVVGNPSTSPADAFQHIDSSGGVLMKIGSTGDITLNSPQEIHGTKMCMTASSNGGTSVFGASGTNYLYKEGQLMTATKGMVMQRSGSIVGLSCNHDVTATTGAGLSLVLSVMKNGGSICTLTLGTGVANDQKAYTTFARGAYTFSQNDVISFALTFAGNKGPTLTADKVLANIEFYHDT